MNAKIYIILYTYYGFDICVFVCIKNVNNKIQNHTISYYYNLNKQANKKKTKKIGI